MKDIAMGDLCGMCGQTGRPYLPGVRCPDHTPARLAGHPEPAPDPTLTLAAMRARRMPITSKGDRYGRASEVPSG